MGRGAERRGRLELIDRLLASGALRGKVSTVTAGDSARADTSAEAAEVSAGADVPSATDDPNERRNATGSDHRPVRVTLEW